MKTIEIEGWTIHILPTSSGEDVEVECFLCGERFKRSSHDITLDDILYSFPLCATCAESEEAAGVHKYILNS